MLSPSQTDSRPAPPTFLLCRLLPTARRHHQAQDLDGLRILARPSSDGYVRNRLAWLLADLGHEPEFFKLATVSRKASRAVAELFARQGRIDELLRHTACGNGFAKRALSNWPITGLVDEDLADVLERGLTPDGKAF
jgi:hypothetical protein